MSTPDAAQFDAYTEDYADQVNKSISFIGQDVDYFARHKALLLLELALHHVGAPARQRLLDLGCGVGQTDRHLVGAVEELHGVDVSEGAIETARQLVPGGTFTAYDGTRLPYPDDRFDFAYAANVMHHVPPSEWWGFLAEARRVVRPGGIVAVIEHNPLNPMTRQAVAGCEFDADAVLLSRRKLRGLIKGAKLVPVEARYITFFPRGAERLMRVERMLRGVPLGAQHLVAGRVP